jgi:Amt family ammonium transporter
MRLQRLGVLLAACTLNAWAQVEEAAPAVQRSASAMVASTSATATAYNGADTAWMLMATVLVLMMTLPGIFLFYSGLLRSKNALSIAVQTLMATALITLLWGAIAYSLAFTAGGPWLGGLSRALAQGLTGMQAQSHAMAATIPETVFFMFQLAFAVVTFALVLGATVERMRIGVTLTFCAMWLLLIYVPVAHWVWHPEGWLALQGQMDFAGGTVVHVLAGSSALVAALMVGPRKGFGSEAMMPSNLLTVSLGACLLWIGWFGFNAGSALEAGARAASAMVATHFSASAGGFVWGLCELIERRKISVLGVSSGAIAGLVAVTPAAGFVDLWGAVAMGVCAGVVCYVAATQFKAWSGIDDSLDVFALHGVGGFLGSALTPLLASAAIAPVTATVLSNTAGAAAVMAYSGGMTWVILWLIRRFVSLRVTPEQELEGLDLVQHGEQLLPH